MPAHAKPPRPPWPDASQAALLHHGGAAGGWGSLGLWRGATDYAGAARALAEAVGHAAGLAPGRRVLSLACGAGDELLLWLQAFGAAEVLGVERDPRTADAARLRLADAGLTHRARVITADVMAIRIDDLGGPGRFDAVLCVDAAYHLVPRSAFLQRTARLLRPGGRLAFTDLSLAPDIPGGPLLRGAARLCGLSFDQLLPPAAQRQRLQDAGFVDVQIEALDDLVLGGFARFVAAQGRRLGPVAWQGAWLRPALTAALMAPCQRRGLGCTLLSARRAG